MTPSSTRFRVLLLGVACSLVASVAVVVLAARGYGPDARNEARPRSPVTSEPLPLEVMLSLQESTEPEFTVADIRAARRLVPDSRAWLVEAAGQTCMVRLLYPVKAGSSFPPAVSRRCATAAEARAGKLVSARSLVTSGDRASDAEVVGAAPSGTAWVEVRSKSGRLTKPIPVYSGGGFLVRALEPSELILESRARRKKSIPLAFYVAGNIAPDSQAR